MRADCRDDAAGHWSCTGAAGDAAAAQAATGTAGASVKPWADAGAVPLECQPGPEMIRTQCRAQGDPARVRAKRLQASLGIRRLRRRQARLGLGLSQPEALLVCNLARLEVRCRLRASIRLNIAIGLARRPQDLRVSGARRTAAAFSAGRRQHDVEGENPLLSPTASTGCSTASCGLDGIRVQAPQLPPPPGKVLDPRSGPQLPAPDSAGAAGPASAEAQTSPSHQPVGPRAGPGPASAAKATTLGARSQGA